MYAQLSIISTSSPHLEGGVSGDSALAFYLFVQLYDRILWVDLRRAAQVRLGSVNRATIGWTHRARSFDDVHTALDKALTHHAEFVDTALRSSGSEQTIWPCLLQADGSDRRPGARTGDAAGGARADRVGTRAPAAPRPDSDAAQPRRGLLRRFDLAAGRQRARHGRGPRSRRPSGCQRTSDPSLSDSLGRCPPQPAIVADVQDDAIRARQRSAIGKQSGDASATATPGCASRSSIRIRRSA